MAFVLFCLAVALVLGGAWFLVFALVLDKALRELDKL